MKTIKRIIIAMTCLLLSNSIFGQLDWGTTMTRNGGYGYQHALEATNDLTGYSYAFKGKAFSRLSPVAAYSNNGYGIGLMGYVTDVSYLKRSNTTGEAYAVGGNFIASTNNLSFYSNSNIKYLVNGVAATLKGTISSIPSNAIVSALFCRDQINLDKTYAGYFVGKVLVDGPIECEEIEVQDVISANNINSEQINTNSLNVTVNNVADYVFNEDYKLRSIDEVEQFVKTNKHLPDIPKGADLEKNGMNVAEMNNLLLQKIEELTLYIIEQDKRISDLEGSK